ncbi:DsrE family protein [Desulforamulus ruminis]|uniref:Uncharacterized protein n=1 Tax=Desulforamulus ruminis (strain ATCC 23193 / DSM 2154 / NCIMB 8452 / DL) TaxID=696281 RepID=F6DRK9_DESRL|nr:DsrE family protein [Desulforamulus ruminis]AEG58763.1 hypothetical protein Desru_0477 [Desulforamulus ruminis DSM 2154]
MKDLKVLFHVSDNEVWPKALLNITNFLKDVGQNGAEVEVVANAGAVMAYYPPEEKKEQLEQMAKLSHMGVKFTACRNALNAHSLDESQRPGFVEVVPGGITEVVKKQTEGFIYIKP